MDTFSEPLTDSETIGTPPPESEGASSIGLRPGGTGYAKTPTTLAEIARRLPETHKQARKARAGEHIEDLLALGFTQRPGGRWTGLPVPGS